MDSQVDQHEPLGEFRQSLRAWAYAAWDVFKSHLSDAWHTNQRPIREEGDVIGAWSTVPEVLWPERYTSVVMALPQWQRVLAAIRANEVLRRHVQDGVGTALGSSHFSENSIAYALWPSRSLVAQWLRGEDSNPGREGAFTQIYDAIESFFTCMDVRYVVTGPIAGLRCEHVPLRLEDDVELDIMTPDEIAEATGRGVLRDDFGRVYTMDDLPMHMRYCLRRTITTPKLVGSVNHNQAEGERLLWLPSTDRKRLERTLSVVLDDRCVIQSFISRQVGWNPAGGTLVMPRTATPYAKWSKGKVLARADEANVIHAWRYFGDSAFEGIASLRISVDRLAGLNTRGSAEDELLDLAIAVEVFFRAGDAGERQGMRVKQRMMDYIQASDMSFDANDVGGWSDLAYQMRNDLVHKGTVGPTRLPASLDPNEGRMSLTQFTETYERLVRRALARHVRGSETPRPPSWPNEL